MDDLRVALEDWFEKNGEPIPVMTEDGVQKGEKEIDDRIKMLKLANKASCYSVDNYVTDLL